MYFGGSELAVTLARKALYRIHIQEYGKIGLNSSSAEINSRKGNPKLALVGGARWRTKTIITEVVLEISERGGVFIYPTRHNPPMAFF